DLNMVFQNYALFPHLSVYNNVAFELKVRRADRTDAKRRVAEMLELVQLTGMENRKPTQLSGGQRQRVALARALVGNPTVLLLDEPLGALDQKLRKGMQVELKRIQREVGITFIYVTHDQEEALTMSHRVAVMHAGRPLQIDSPRVLYDAPETEFVASFIGRSNFLHGKVGGIEAEGRVTVDVPGLGSIYATPASGAAGVGADVTVAVRPERVAFADPGLVTAGNRLNGVIRDVMFAGDDTEYIVLLSNGAEFSVRRQNAGESGGDRTPGEDVTLTWNAASSRVLMG
ncbi:MAG TPA: ABC transporter ATP-binding protein, partial [Pseudonocardiaceae bacterium]|nr:ABC transporter ATP-binding protein [Pseudonocardiaceae bacterium]